VPRLFLGTLADIEEQKRTEQLFADLKTTAPAQYASSNIKFTAPENLHMTWAFIGDVPQESVEDLQLQLHSQMRQIQEMKLPPVLVFDSVEIWPEEMNPTLFVLTPTETHPAVLNCAQSIHRLVGPFMSSPEILPFRAHVTLARLKKDCEAVAAMKNDLKTLQPFEIKLTDIGLFASAFIGRQTAYRAIAKYAL